MSAQQSLGLPIAAAAAAVQHAGCEIATSAGQPACYRVADAGRARAAAVAAVVIPQDVEPHHRGQLPVGTRPVAPRVRTCGPHVVDPQGQMQGLWLTLKPLSRTLPWALHLKKGTSWPMSTALPWLNSSVSRVCMAGAQSAPGWGCLHCRGAIVALAHLLGRRHVHGHHLLPLLGGQLQHPVLVLAGPADGAQSPARPGGATAWMLEHGSAPWVQPARVHDLVRAADIPQVVVRWGRGKERPPTQTSSSVREHALRPTCAQLQPSLLSKSPGSTHWLATRSTRPMALAGHRTGPRGGLRPLPSAAAVPRAPEWPLLDRAPGAAAQLGELPARFCSAGPTP